jgi:predicted outer membrane repeat protein
MRSFPFSCAIPGALGLVLACSTVASGTNYMVMPDSGWKIQDAVNAAANGDTIFLVAGTYRGTGNRDVDYQGKAITITRYASTQTPVIDCEGTESEWHRGFILHSGEGPGSVLDGVTIINGRECNSYGGFAPPSPKAVLLGGSRAEYDTHMSGGAILAREAAPTIRNCTFRDNSVTGAGGAVACESEGETAILDCRFTHNSATGFFDGADHVDGCGGGLAALGRVRGDGCVFYDNSADVGAGMAGQGAWGQLHRCTFHFNDAADGGGALSIELSPNFLDLTECTFTANTAPAGAGVEMFGGLARMRECTFVGNSSFHDGGAIRCADSGGWDGHSGLEMTNCTLHFCCAGTGHGGGLFLEDAPTVTIEKTIIAYGCKEAVYCDPSMTTTPTLSCCDLYGNSGGDWVGCVASQNGVNGNFAADPMFCDMNHWDLTLHTASPCAPGGSPDACGLIGSKDVACGPAWFPGLGGGALIVHYAPGVQYSLGADACSDFLGQGGIRNCAQQGNRIDGGPSASVWFVLAAWSGEKTWCASQFGFGHYDPQAFEFADWGACGPTGFQEIATPNWPGPNSGTTLLADAGNPWSGNFVPIYWFAGYAEDGVTVIPLAENPQTGWVGWTDCEQPPQDWSPVCLGAMGINTYGQYCCPPEGEQPPPASACCLEDGSCLLVQEEMCSTLGGAWHPEWDSCDPPPCNQPVAACCVGDECLLATAAECRGLEGAWHPGSPDCSPNPCASTLDFADHNVGDCVLTVTDRGILGFLDPTQGAGSGFVYPRDGESRLFLGSLWIGQSSAYIANRDYAADPAQEWTVAAAPDGHIGIEPGGGDSDQDIHAGYTDSAAVVPRGLYVHQQSWAYADEERHDFVILNYEVTNRSAAPLADLYVGLFLDIDIEQYEHNTGAVDGQRNLVYLTDPSGVHVGSRLLRNADVPPVGNLTLIHNPTYVWPNQYVPDPDKYGFLTAAGPQYVLTDAANDDDYSTLASAGPITLEPGETQLIAFAIVGGGNLEALQTHADAAQEAFCPIQATIDRVEPTPPVTQLLPACPNPCQRETCIRFDLAVPGEARVNLYDPMGRLVRTLARGWHPAAQHRLSWDGRDETGQAVAAGVYFLRFEAPGRVETRRVTLLQ